MSHATLKQFALDLAKTVKAKVVPKADPERDAAEDARRVYLQALEEREKALSRTDLAQLSDKFHVANMLLLDEQYRQAADTYRALKHDLDSRYWKTVEAAGRWDVSSRQIIAQITNALDQAKSDYLTQGAAGADAKKFEPRWTAEIETPVLNRIEQYVWLGEDHRDPDGGLKGLTEVQKSYLPGLVRALSARVVGEKDADDKRKAFHVEHGRVAQELDALKRKITKHATGQDGDRTSKDPPTCKSLEYLDRQLSVANDSLYVAKGRGLIGPALDKSLAASRASLTKLSAEIAQLNDQLEKSEAGGGGAEQPTVVWQEQATREYAKSWEIWSGARDSGRRELDELAGYGGNDYREQRAMFDAACRLAEGAQASFANLQSRFPIASGDVKAAKTTLAEITASLHQAQETVNADFVKAVQVAIERHVGSHAKELDSAKKALRDWKKKLKDDNLLDVPAESTFDRWPAAPAPIQAILTDRLGRANSAWAAHDSDSLGAVQSATAQLEAIHHELKGLAKQYDQTFGKSGARLMATFESLDKAVDKAVEAASKHCPTLARELLETYQREFKNNPACLTIDQALERAASFEQRYLQPARAEVLRAATTYADEKKRIGELQKRMMQLHQGLKLPGEMCGAFGARLKALLAELERADGSQQIMKTSLAVAQLDQQFRLAVKAPDFNVRIAADAAKSQQIEARRDQALQAVQERYEKFVQGPYRKALSQPTAAKSDCETLERLNSVVRQFLVHKGLEDAETQFAQMRQLAAEMTNQPTRRSIRHPQKLHESWTNALRQYGSECDGLGAAVAARVNGHFQSKGTPGDGQAMRARVDDLLGRIRSRLDPEGPMSRQLYAALTTLAEQDCSPDDARRARELALRAIHWYRDWIENDPIVSLLTSRKNPFDPRLSVAALRKSLNKIEVQVLLSAADFS